MIIRQSTARQSRCIFCQLLPAQQSRTATTRADLAIPRYDLLAEAITGPTDEELRAAKAAPSKWSSPASRAILERYKLKRYWSQSVNRLGSVRDTGSLVPTEPGTRRPADEVTLELLMASQAHMGHNTSLWNPMNSRYIFGVRAGIHIISLEQTAAHLKRAARVVQGVAENAGIILFVGTRKGQRHHVVKAAKMTGGYHLFTRWIPGTITNGQQILQQGVVTPVDALDQRIAGYEEEIKEAVAPLKPDLVVCMNPMENKTLLHECALYTIPTIGVIDTDADPTLVTFPIPANDDSPRAIGVIARVLGRAGKKGRAIRLAGARAGEVAYKPFDLSSIEFDKDEDKEDLSESEVAELAGSADDAQADEDIDAED